MLSDLPNELLYNILSHLDNLTPLSTSSRTISSAVRDHQASTLRRRIAALRHADLLVTIFSPPTFTFFTRDELGRRHTSDIYHPRDLLNVLRDPCMFPRIDSYISSLEHKENIARRLAGHVVSLLDFSAFSSRSEAKTFATIIILHLWSIRPRVACDIDGYLESLHPSHTPADLFARDEFLARSLTPDKFAWLAPVYSAVEQAIRPPFGARDPLWLHRLIVRVSSSAHEDQSVVADCMKGGMESVLEEMERALSAS
jgi:hypothetical protein